MRSLRPSAQGPELDGQYRHRQRCTLADRARGWLNLGVGKDVGEAIVTEQVVFDISTLGALEQKSASVQIARKENSHIVWIERCPKATDRKAQASPTASSSRQTL